jgi:hypothetical protein
MFVRERIVRNHRYLYLVENTRAGGGCVRRRIVRALGREDRCCWPEWGTRSTDHFLGALYSERAMIVSD